MRQILLFTSALFLATTLHAQRSDSFERDYQKVKTTLKSWDPIRGAWLADAMPAVIDRTTVPVRTFPENATPMDVMSLVPAETRNELLEVAEDNSGTGRDQQFWTQFNNLVQSSACSELEATSINRRPVSRARSYGDPHLVTYDGERISFQAVGEFVLTKADDNRFEVQTRQRPVQDDFSLNTAVAMNMNGDRVCLYAEDFPDMNTNNPLRVNGQPVQVNGGNYFLPNGGVIRRSGQSYIFDWPTGESVTAREGRTSGMNFFNVSVNIVPCGAANLSGVLGNADGNGRNDFDNNAWSTPGGIFASNNENWQRERSAFAIRNMADQHRVTQATSLFDYGFGQSTFFFTDRSYPRAIRTVNDLDPVRRDRARRRCNEAGIRGADLDGCIYDNAYLNITPCPEPPIRQPVVTPETVTPIRQPVVNDNPEPPIVPIGTVGPGRVPGGGSNNPGDVKPGTVRPADGIDTPRTPVPRTPKGDVSNEEQAPVKDVQTEEKKKRTFTWGSSSPSEEEEPTRTTTPTRTRSTWSSPSRSEPSTSPTRSTPTRTTPTRTTPTRSTPTRTAPTRSTPRSTPTRSTPTRSTPTRSTPRSTPSRGGGRGGR
ncbi:MAG: VWD domain-containing protein [bacterium]|nr:VWD domain-containing protein [bacterium]